MGASFTKTDRNWALLVLAVLSLPCSGCLLAMAGAAGAGGYAYYQGNVEAAYEGEFAAVWSATHDALASLALPVLKQTHDARSGVIESITGTQKKVVIKVEQITPKIPTDHPRTAVGVRVGTFGDDEVSGRILQSIHLRRAPS